MHAVLRKIWADVTTRPLISLLIGTSIATSTALVTLAVATVVNSSAPYDRSFDLLNAAHVWIYFNRDQIRARDIDQIEALPIVEASTGIQYSVTSRVAAHRTRIWTSIRAIETPQATLNQLLIQDGRDLEPKALEILAGSELVDLVGLSVDDVVGVVGSDGYRVDVPVVGLAYNPMWDTYRNTQPPYLYVTQDTLRRLFPDEDAWESSMGLRLTDPNAVDEALTQIEGILRSDAIATHTDWRDVREAAVFGAQLNLVFLGTFSLFAVLATVLVIASSIGSAVLSQYRQIGILKAIGFRRRQVLWVYLGQYLVLCAFGCPTGLFLGALLSPLPLRSVAASLSTTFQPALNPLVAVLAIGSVSGAVILATLGAARRGAGAHIIQAITTGVETPRRQTQRIGTALAQAWIPTFLALGVGDVFVRPIRSLLTALNLTLGVMGVVFGLALNDTLGTYEREPELLGIVYDGVVTRESYSDSHTRALLSRAPGVIAYYGEYLADARTPAGDVFQVRAVDGDLDAFPFQITEGRFFEPGTHEAIAGQGLLDWLDLDVGDVLTITLSSQGGGPIALRIVGRYPEPVNSGQMLMVSLPTVVRSHVRVEPRTYYIRIGPDADVARLRTFLEPGRNADLNLVLIGQALPGAVRYLKLAILSLAAILVGFALINVFTTSLLAVQEKLRRIGVLKTIGMTPLQVVAMVTSSATVLGLGAAVIGMPLGLALTKVTLSTLSGVYGFGEVNVTLSPLYAALVAPLMVAVGIGGSIVPARRAADASIVEVLRYE
ncbi:MAG: FtsX-like permease family protein [Chloroflexi bacterium]|nr:FtsX-like permease family protein [Chloroflexota bacterium]